jgi:Leucine-rich repeat (LRR) protein
MKTLFTFKIRLWIIGALFISSMSFAQAPVAGDSAELQRFYNTNGGSGWSVHWDFNTPIASWAGVSCHANGRVRALRLPNTGLTGRLKLNLGYLDTLILTDNLLDTVDGADLTPCLNLKYLHLSNNQIKGQIPRIGSLTYLDLHNNLFSGNIPNFQNLTYLDLSNNELSGGINELSSSPLSSLKLSSNQFSGALPDIIQYNNLTTFDISNNYFTGNVPIFNCPQLTTLSLSNNFLNQPNFAFSNFTNDTRTQLKTLHFTDNRLTAHITAYDWRVFSTLVTLTLDSNRTAVGQLLDLKLPNTIRQLSLRATNLAGTINDIDTVIQQPTLLQALSLRQNQLTGTRNSWQGYSNLQYLDISYNPLTSTPLVDIQFPNTLNALYAESNNLTGIIPNFASLPRLTRLNLSYNPLGAGDIPLFARDSFLIELNLSGTNRNANLRDFVLPSIQYLALSDNPNIRGMIPNFSNMPNLTGLMLGNDSLTGKIPNFSASPKLERLYLHHNLLIDTIPNFTHTSLTYLYLNDNQLNSRNPIFASQVFKELDLSKNFLDSTLATLRLDGLKQLKYLNLSYNRFTGSIPDAYKAAFPKLNTLSLQYNYLSGAIPTPFNCPRLHTFRLNHNQLTGSFQINTDSLSVFDVSSNRLASTVMPLIRWHTDSNRRSAARVDSNQLTFIHLYNLVSDTIRKIYAPQDSFFKDSTLHITVNCSKTIDLQIDNGIVANKYQWFKNDTIYGTVIGSNKLTFANVRLADSGTYKCSVTNTDFPNLTLYSRKIKLIVDTVAVRPLDTTICYGKFYQTSDGRRLTIAGAYNDILLTEGGCVKALLNVNLAVAPIPIATHLYSRDSVCSYADTLKSTTIPNALNCDSTIWTHAPYRPMTRTVTESVCDLSLVGTTFRTIASSCDTVVTTHKLWGRNGNRTISFCVCNQEQQGVIIFPVPTIRGCTDTLFIISRWTNPDTILPIADSCARTQPLPTVIHLETAYCNCDSTITQNYIWHRTYDDLLPPIVVCRPKQTDTTRIYVDSIFLPQCLATIRQPYTYKPDTFYPPIQQRCAPASIKPDTSWGYGPTCDTIKIQKYELIYSITTQRDSPTCNRRFQNRIDTVTTPNPAGCTYIKITNFLFKADTSDLLLKAICGLTDTNPTYTHNDTSRYCDTVFRQRYRSLRNVTDPLVDSFVCNRALVGQTLTYVFKTSEGCDSVVRKYLKWGCSDTVRVDSVICNQLLNGTFDTLPYINPNGYASIRIRALQWFMPLTLHRDTLVRNQRLVGKLFETIYVNRYGCDSTTVMHGVLNLGYFENWAIFNGVIQGRGADGQNIFCIKNINLALDPLYVQSSLTIINDRQEVVFSKEGCSKESDFNWEGLGLNGEPLPAGKYAYILKSGNLMDKPRTGYILLHYRN